MMTDKLNALSESWKLYNKTHKREQIWNKLLYTISKGDIHKLTFNEQEWIDLIKYSDTGAANKLGDIPFKTACLRIKNEKEPFISPTVLQALISAVDLEALKNAKNQILPVFDLDLRFDKVKDTIIENSPLSLMIALMASNDVAKTYIEQSPHAIKIKNYENLLNRFFSNPCVDNFNDIMETVKEPKDLQFLFQKSPNFDLTQPNFFEKLWFLDVKSEYLPILKNYTKKKWWCFIFDNSSILLSSLLNDDIIKNNENRNLILNSAYSYIWHHKYKKEIRENFTAKKIKPKDTREQQFLLHREIIRVFWQQQCSDLIFKEEIDKFKLEFKKEIEKFRKNKNNLISNEPQEKEEKENFYYEHEKVEVEKYTSMLNSFASTHKTALLKDSNRQYFYTYLLDLSNVLQSTESKREFLDKRDLLPLERDAAIDLLTDCMLIVESRSSFVYLPHLLNFQQMIRKNHILQEKILLESNLNLHCIENKLNKKFKL